MGATHVAVMCSFLQTTALPEEMRSLLFQLSMNRLPPGLSDEPSSFSAWLDQAVCGKIYVGDRVDGRWVLASNREVVGHCAGEVARGLAAHFAEARDGHMPNAGYNLYLIRARSFEGREMDDVLADAEQAIREVGSVSCDQALIKRCLRWQRATNQVSRILPNPRSLGAV